MTRSPEVEIDDEEIILLLLDGQEEGIRLLLRAHGPAVKAILKSSRSSSLLNEEDFESALYVGAYKAFKKIASYDESRSKLRTWFINITKHALVDNLRAERSPGHSTLSFDPQDEADDLYNTDEKIDPRSPKGRLLSAIREAIENLPSQQKAILMADLAANGKADATTIAERLGTTTNTIYVQRNKAIKKLKDDEIVKKRWAELRGVKQ